MAHFLLGTPVRDIDCALKVFRRDALERILPETGGFFVNTEMLTKARQLHIGIAEVGVRHRPRERGDSKVSTGDIPRVLNALLPFWWTRVLFAGADESDPQESLRSSWGLQTTLYVALLALAAVLFFARLDHPLLEPEEARYAEIPREMLLEGRVLTPVLHGEDYWQKPPLLYWLVMLSYKIFGVHDWAARLVPALAGIWCVAVTTWWGRRTLGFWPGLVAGAILTLSARFLYLAGMLTMDGVLCACVLTALACGHLALTESNRRKRWLVLSALACALGILTKGPVAVLLVAAPLIALAFLDRRCQWLSKLEAAGCLAVVVLVAGPWYLGMALGAPDAAGSFVWVHNLMRYVSPIDHEKPAWFYLPSLLLGMLPWSLLLVPMVPYFLRKSLRTGRRRPAALGMFVLAFAWCVLFFSLSGCKRPAYVLPAFPLLALIIGTFVTHGFPWQRWMEAASAMRLGHRWARMLAVTGAAMGVTLAIAAAIVGLASWPESAFLAAAFCVIGVFLWASSKQAPAWTSWLNCTAVVFCVLMLGQRAWLPAYHDRFGLRRQVEISSEYEQEEPLPILTYPKQWDSISFYARRTDVTACTDIDALLAEVRTHGQAMIFVRREGSLAELQRALPADLELELLGHDADYVAVGIVRSRSR
jgi:dolichol-phosphate mannosyltransferase